MKEGKTKQIDELVDQVLRNMGLEQKFKEHEVCMIWPEVVGQMIASRTKSVRVMDGVQEQTAIFLLWTTFCHNLF